jgi:ferredoxin
VYLRSGEPSAICIENRGQHVLDELLDRERGYVFGSDGLGDLSQHRVSHSGDLQDGHDLLVSHDETFTRLSTTRFSVHHGGPWDIFPLRIKPKNEEYMADANEKWEDNIAGHSVIQGKKISFYVDMECILCSVCSDAAPNNFRMSDEEDHDICYKQPENEEELEQCFEAMENCPVEAIGDDG